MIPAHFPITMHSLFLQIAAAILASAALTMGMVHAAPYAEGSKVEPFTAQTQHEKNFTVKPSETRFLLVSHDMETGKKANAVLTTVGPQNLSNKKIVYLANIHGMPGVGRMFALPKMRKYSHTIILGDDAGLIAKFPEQKNKVTVLKLAEGKVSSVQYWSPGAEPLDGFLK
jgi:hypothetical protein